MDWKPVPWLAAVLGLIAQPLGMLYVQRPWLATGYFLVAALVGVMAFFSMWAFGSETLEVALSMSSWAIAIGCAVHAFHIARGTAAVGERRWYSRWYGLACFPAVVFMVGLAFRSFVYEPFRIPSDSMYPTIPAGSIMFVKKSGFGHYGTYGISLWGGESTEPIVRGDIVVHELAAESSVRYVHRVVAIPGDHIQYLDRRLVINGQPVPVQIGREDVTYRYAVERLDGHEVTVAFMHERPSVDFDQVVPRNQYALFGDNRDNARDSRFVGLVPRECIIGRVVKILPPRQARSE